MESARLARGVAWTASYGFLVVLAFLALFPFTWGLITSLKTSRQIAVQPFALIPAPLSFENYTRAIQRGMSDGLRNSILVAVISVALTIALASLSGYALARIRFRFSSLALFCIIAPQFVPGLVNLVPTYIIMSRLHLIDTYTVLILLHTVQSLPMAVWILKAFFETVPAEIEQAAMVDGCTRWSSLTQIMLPLAQPGIAAAALFTFVSSWNEFLVAVTMTTSAGMRTLPVAIYLSITDVGIDWGALLAGATVAVVPIILLFLFLQQQFISGLTAGALKG
ncbi:MAG: carbohydrate ABC transporter permease [Chloroflexota bacterium]